MHTDVYQLNIIFKKYFSSFMFSTGRPRLSKGDNRLNYQIGY